MPVDVLTAVNKKGMDGTPYSRVYEPLIFRETFCHHYHCDALLHQGSKGKVLLRTGHEGPEGEQTYSSTLPSTSALDGGEWSAPRPGRFTPWKDPVV